MSPEQTKQVIEVGYLVAAVCFILSLKLLNSPLTARKGNALAAVGMAIALGVTFALPGISNWGLILGGFAIGSVLGVVSARRVAMTAMPQMVALLNGLGGGAVALVALVEFLESNQGAGLDSIGLVTAVLSAIIGSVSFSGSVIAFGKLQELITSRAVTGVLLKVATFIALAGIIGIALSLTFGTPRIEAFLLLLGLSVALGVLGVIPIGGADMPVVISLLNSFTGCAAGLAGFVLGNTALLIGGGLVGASGLILTLQMCSAMNRSLENVLFGAFGATTSSAMGGSGATGTVRNYSVEDAAIMFSNASSVVIVPGYGLAVAQAQHVVKELANKLAAMGIDVKFAVHSVAGRMPGHMNVLLAEADVPYDQLYDIDQINPLFPETDVALVVGANDVVNPSARYDKASPVYGMPILDVDKAQNCIVIKRSMKPGFAGIDNELFVMPNTSMVFGDAKQVITKMVAALEPYA